MRLQRTTITTLNLPQGRSEITYFDDAIGGFGIRIRKTGARSWVFQYDNAAGHTRRITLGKVSALDANKARTIASQLHARVRLGEDVAAVKSESQARAAETFGAILPAYLRWHRTRVRPSTYRHTERHLLHNLTALHSLPIAQVDRRVIATQLARMVDSPVQANRTRSSLSAFLNWALREGMVDSNAALATNKNVERPRERVLSNSELRALWNAVNGDDYADIVRLLILTGAREREIADLQWDEINFEKGIIELPPQRTKNRRRHVIPMSGAVRAILERRERNGRAFVFGRSETRGFSGWSKCKERLDEVLKIPPWTIHDLRRVCSTGMNEIGIEPHIVEAILNHVSGAARGGIAGRYNYALYESQKVTALRRWATHVAAIVEGRDSNIMPMHRGVS